MSRVRLGVLAVNAIIIVVAVSSCYWLPIRVSPTLSGTARVAQQNTLREQFVEAARVVRAFGIDKVVKELESLGVDREPSEVLAIEAARRTGDLRLKPMLEEISQRDGPLSKFAKAALDDYSNEHPAALKE